MMGGTSLQPAAVNIQTEIHGAEQATAQFEISLGGHPGKG